MAKKGLEGEKMVRQLIFFTALILLAVSRTTWSEEVILSPLNDFCTDINSITSTPWGDLVLSVPNEGAGDRIALLARLHEKKIYLWGVAPISPSSGRGVPYGITFGEDENLYLCDNQDRVGGGKEGRILRILVNPSRRPYAAQLVASGIIEPHRIKTFGEYLYVTEYFHPTQESTELWESSLYRFPIHVENIPATSLPDDPSVVHTFSFANPTQRAAAVSLCFDPGGQLYIGNSAEGAIYHLTLTEKGEVEEVTEYLRSEELSSMEGMAADESGNFYIVNREKNAVFRITREKTVEALLQGEEHGFRRPEDLCVTGGFLYFTCQTEAGIPAVGIWSLSEQAASHAMEKPALP